MPIRDPRAMIRVRLAHTDDQDDLVDYIRDHWSPTHVFTQEPAVFAWQYRQADGRLNMMMAEDVTDDGRSVIGVLGFIPMGRFDQQLGDTDLTLAIWHVRDGSPPGVGLRLLKQLAAELQPRLIAAIGISDIVVPIYKVLRYEVGALEQSAIFNPRRAGELHIADHVPDEAFAADDPAWPDTVHFTRLDAATDVDARRVIDEIARASRPAKSWDYVAARYLDHPWYDYTVSLVTHRGTPAAAVVWRTVVVEGTAVLRIVDIIGSTEWLADARRALTSEVVAADAEYLDLMQCGIDPDIIDAGGFVGIRTHPDIVIPNYFAPFERRNIQIDLAYKRIDDDADRPLHLYRADSDQDRPNSLAEVRG